MSLRTRLIIAFLLLSVVPLTAVTLLSYRSSVNAFERAARREATESAADVSHRMEIITADVGRRMDRLFVAGTSAPRPFRPDPERRTRQRRAAARRRGRARRARRVPARGGPAVPSAAPRGGDRRRRHCGRAPRPPTSAAQTHAAGGAGTAGCSPRLRRRRVDGASTSRRSSSSPPMPRHGAGRRVRGGLPEEAGDSRSSSRSRRTRRRSRRWPRRSRVRREARRRPRGRRSTSTGRRVEVAVQKDGRLLGRANATLNMDRTVRTVLALARRDQGEIPFALDRKGALYYPGRPRQGAAAGARTPSGSRRPRRRAARSARVTGSSSRARTRAASRSASRARSANRCGRSGAPRCATSRSACSSSAWRSSGSSRFRTG